MGVVVHAIRKSKIIEAATPDGGTRRIALVTFIAMGSDTYNEDRYRGEKSSPAQIYRMRVGAAERSWEGCDMPDAVMHDEFKHGERIEAWKPGNITGTDYDDVEIVGWLRKYKEGRRVKYEIMPLVFHVTTFDYDRSGNPRESYSGSYVFDPNKIAEAVRELCANPKNDRHGICVVEKRLDGSGVVSETHIHREPGDLNLTDGADAKALAATLNKNGCTASIDAGSRRIVFHNGSGTDHSLALAASDTGRVLAHWEGFAGA